MDAVSETVTVQIFVARIKLLQRQQTLIYLIIIKIKFCHEIPFNLKNLPSCQAKHICCDPKVI